MSFLLLKILGFLSLCLDLYKWILIGTIILGWLIVFNVINPRNEFVAMVNEFFYRVTEPVLAPIRRRLPSFGAVDLSPIVVFLIIIFIQSVIIQTLAQMLV